MPIPAPKYRTRKLPQALIAKAEKLAHQHTKKVILKKTYPKVLTISFRNRRDCAELVRLIKKWTDAKTISISGVVDRPRSARKIERHDGWVGMPEFQQNRNDWVSQRMKVSCRTANAYAALANVLRQRLTILTKSAYFPKWSAGDVAGFCWKSTLPRNRITPRYPIYIVSKGRAYSRLTSKTLDEMNVPYYIVIEPHEYDAYASVIDKKKILTLPYVTDPANPTGPGRAREWCARHAAADGYRRHWVMDDNILNFFRLHNNRRYRVADGAIFRAAEDFVDRYDNVLVAGFQYRHFAASKLKYPPFVANTRIYSCLLIDNRFVFELPPNAPADEKPKLVKRPKVMGDHQFLWREQYNEDTILSLDVMWNGFCTVQFNAFLQGKVATQVLKGGNSEIFYSKEGSAKVKFSGDGRYNPGGTVRKSVNLEVVYPEVDRTTFRYNRTHHHVDYRRFKKNEMKLRKGHRLFKGVNNYGMRLVPNSSRNQELMEQYKK